MLSDSLKYDVATHFRFGENWSNFVKNVTPEQIDQATDELKRLVGAERMLGKRFLDVGCGSGLHALAALRSGVAFVEAIDFDPSSVETTRELLRQHYDGENSNYTVHVANILEPPRLAEFDIVYSWGVLHHTGAMWEAIDQTTRFVRPGGRLVIAIYVKTLFCGWWRLEKRLFSRLGHRLQTVVASGYAGLCILRLLGRGINPIRHIREYGRFRGMSWWHDRIDWLGGYPYESASAEEVVRFLEARGFVLAGSFGTKAGVGLLGSGCAEYVFDRIDSTDSDPAPPPVSRR